MSSCYVTRLQSGTQVVLTIYMTDLPLYRDVLHCVSKNDTGVARYNVDADKPLLTDVLLRQRAIKWWFVNPPLLNNVSAVPGETWTPEILSSVMLYTVSTLRSYIIKYSVRIISRYCLQNLLKLVDECRRYSKPKQCRCRDTIYSVTEKTQFPGFICFPR